MSLSKLQRQATAYVLSEKISNSLRDKLEHSPFTLESLVDQLVVEELEPWQFCYIDSYNPTDKMIPEYIVESISEETIESYITDTDGIPELNQSNPYKEDVEMVQASGSEEDYCQNQISWFRQACISSFRNDLEDFLLQVTTRDSYSDDEIYTIAEEIVNTVGLWKWSILTNRASEQSDNSQGLVNEWILSGLNDTLHSILQANGITTEEIKEREFNTTVNSFETNSDIMVI